MCRGEAYVLRKSLLMESTWIQNCLYYMFCLFLYLKGGKILISLTNIVPLFLYKFAISTVRYNNYMFQGHYCPLSELLQKIQKINVQYFHKTFIEFFLKKRIEVSPLSPKASLTWFMYTGVYTIYSVQRIHVCM